MKLQAETSPNYVTEKVLDQLQLTLEKGKIYGLTGRIGVGKTTSVLHFIQTAPPGRGNRPFI